MPRFWRLASLLAALVPLSVAHAALPHPGVTSWVRSMALPRSLFPARAAVRGQFLRSTQPVSWLQTGSAPDASGYLMEARWTSGRTQMDLQYLATFHPSSDAARAVAGDATATLWETGRPVQIAGLPHAFRIAERDGFTSVALVLTEGTVEVEVVLRLRHPSARSLREGLYYLWRVRTAASSHAAQLAARLPVPPPAPQGLPAIQVAPWGTGPVVRSPSLMSLTAQILPQGATLLPAGFRRHAARLPAASALRPAGGLSTYAQTAILPGGSLYLSTTLYSSADVAIAALGALESGRSTITFPALATADSAAWRSGNELVVAVRSQNVVFVLIANGITPQAAADIARGVLFSVPTPLHADGTRIVDDWGQPIRLVGFNWYGAEEQDFVVGGLDYQPYAQILRTVRARGYNVIRIPFSNQMVEQDPTVTAHLAANPDLVGLHALDILDRIVNMAGALGLSVILDNHRSDAGWSTQADGLWYTDAYPESAWLHDWSELASRYAMSNVVVAADLRNEPHAKATWGDGNPATDWKAAAQQAGDAVLAVNPRLLIMVEGVQYGGTAAGYWWGGNLMGVATSPVVLTFSDGQSARSQLVYSVHDYGPDNCSGGCPWFNAGTTYASLRAVWEQYWGYITDNSAAPYAAPVWVGEFGTCNYNATCVQDTTPGSQGQWFSSLVQYLGEKDLGWAYWSLNGTQSTAPGRAYGALDWYGYLDQGWSAPVPWLETQLGAIKS